MLPSIFLSLLITNWYTLPKTEKFERKTLCGKFYAPWEKETFHLFRRYHAPRITAGNYREFSAPFIGSFLFLLKRNENKNIFFFFCKVKSSQNLFDGCYGFPLGWGLVLCFIGVFLCFDTNIYEYLRKRKITLLKAKILENFFIYL